MYGLRLSSHNEMLFCFVFYYSVMPCSHRAQMHGDQIRFCSPEQNSSLSWTLCGVTSAVFRLWIQNCSTLDLNPYLVHFHPYAVVLSDSAFLFFFSWLTTGRWTSQNALSWLSRIFLSALSFFLSILSTEEMSHSCREHMPLKYQVKGNEWDPRIKSHTLTIIHISRHTHRLTQQTSQSRKANAKECGS